MLWIHICLSWTNKGFWWTINGPWSGLWEGFTRAFAIRTYRQTQLTIFLFIVHHNFCSVRQETEIPVRKNDSQSAANDVTHVKDFNERLFKDQPHLEQQQQQQQQ